MQLGWVLLFVDDVSASVERYGRVLGLSARFVDPAGDYAELDTGATTLALCARRLGAQSSGLDPTELTGSGSSITLTCADPLAMWHRAVEGGFTSVSMPVRKPWGQVAGYLRDPDGHLIEIATPIEQ